MLALDSILDECGISKFTSLFFDVQKIVRSKSVCTKFNILATEKIWCYHKDDHGFLSRIDLVFTDVGIHTEERTVKYTDLPQFIVTTTELDVVCLLFNEVGEIELSHKNLINTLSEKQDMDLVVFVETIQNLMIASDVEYRQEHEKVKDWFYKSATENIQAEPYYLGTLNYLSKTDKQAMVVRYHAALIDFDYKTLAIEVDELDENSKKKFNADLDEYEKQIKDPHFIIENKKTKSRLRNLEEFIKSDNKNDFLGEYTRVACEAEKYYFVRKSPFSETKAMVKRFYKGSDYSLEKDYFARFCFSHRNYLMGQYLGEIKSGEFLKTKALLGYSDGIGFNILHYAIITGNNVVIDDCFKNYRKIKHYDDNYKSFDFNPFDYILVAGTVGNRDLAIRLNETIGTVGVLLRTKKSLERYIAIRESIHSFAQSYSKNFDNNLNETKKNMSAYDYAEYVKYSDRRNEKKNFDETISNDADYISKLKEDLAEVEAQIELEREQFWQNLELKVSLFCKENDLYISCIRRFYKDPDRLLKALNADIDKVKVVWGDGFFYFNIHDFYEYEWDDQRFSDEESESESQQDTKDKGYTKNRTNGSGQGKSKKNYTRPFGNSWFSPEAHRDYRKLRAEYKDLAKLYHPDNKDGNEDAFKEINAEREAIMERLH